MMALNGSNGRIHRPLHVIKTLGEGMHGKVVLAMDPISGKQVAMKTIKKNLLTNEKEKKHMQQEIDIMSSLHHPHIISVYDVFETEAEVVLVLEYASGGELFDYINGYGSSCDDKHDLHVGGLSDAEARKMFRQLVSAVQYLHERHVVHRDLKLENVLLDSENNAKLADFGLSAVYSEGQLLKTYCGSPLYASPEIVNGRPYHGPEVDVWSLGVLLYAMVYGIMPFDGRDFKTLRTQITCGLVQQPPILSSAHDLILNILNPDLSCRATLTDIASHRWLQEAVIGPPSRPLWFDARSDSSCRSSNDGKRCSFDDGTSFRKQDWIEPDGFSHYAVNGLPVNHTNYGDYTMDGFLSRYNGNCYNGDTHRTVCSPNRYASGGVGQFDGGDPMWRSTIADNDAGFGYESAIVAVDDSRIANARPPVHVTGYRTQLSTDNDDDDCQLVTSFIGPDCHGISGAVDGAQGSPASPPSIASCSSNDAPALRQRSLSRSRTYSADSLELHDCAFVDGRIEADALRCSASEDDNSNSVDECNCSGQGGVACSTCYDFADIDAVLDCLVNKETVGVDGYSYAGSQLSCDSLD